MHFKALIYWNFVCSIARRVGFVYLLICRESGITDMDDQGLTNLYVTGFRKTNPNRTFGILRITNLKYLTHCESLLLGCSHAKFAV